MKLNQSLTKSDKDTTAIHSTQPTTNNGVAMTNPNQQSTLSPQAKTHRQTMWQVEPYNRQGRRLNQNAYLNKLIRHGEKAELSFVGMVIYCRNMCIKHGYPTAF